MLSLIHIYNIANVNTLGFKKSAANFADLYSETVTPASAPSATQGGINAQQVGLGVNVNSIVIKHTPGAAQYTGNTLDLAIDVYKRQAEDTYSAEMVELPKLEDLVAVSYTHLDVYKRQLRERTQRFSGI